MAQREIDTRPATLGDLTELEQRIDADIENVEQHFDREVQNIMQAIKEKRNTYQWIVGAAITVLMIFSGIMVDRLNNLYDRVNTHHENSTLHMTEAERNAKDKEEQTYRENVIRQWEEIKAVLREINPALIPANKPPKK